jgi:chromosome segregation ATPase
MGELETEVKLLKKELEDQRSVHNRLDIAIEKLTDLSNSIHRMLAVHEEKLDRQDEAITDAGGQLEKRRIEILTKIEDLHSRITTNTKEIMTAAATQHAEQNRVGILEKWRHVLIGASIVAGFVLQKYMVIGG